MFKDNLDERFDLSFERIKEISLNPELENKSLASYYKSVAAFIVKL